MTLGTTAIPRWSQNSAPVTAGQWCLITDVAALRWSSSHVPPPPWASREGGARLAWILSTPPVPHCRPSATKLAPPAFILSSSLHPSEKAEETLERSIQPTGKPGAGEGATSLFPSISKVCWRAQKNAPRSQGVPHPTRLAVRHTLEELGLREEESSHCLPQHTPSHPNFQAPRIGTPLLLSPPTPMAVNDRADHTCVFH